MKKNKTVSYVLVSIILFIILFILALTVGRFHISISKLFMLIIGNDDGLSLEKSVILNLRLPRSIMATLTGISLSLSGLLYQETFQNKLTSPDLLGVSNGAGVGAALSIVLGLPTVLITINAFVFACLTVLLTLFTSKLFRNGSSTILILSGVIIGGFMSSILALIKYLAGNEIVLASITYWLMGSFADSTMNSIYIISPIVLICTVYLLIISWRINIISLGQEEAQTKGLNYKLYRSLIIGIATLLTAITVAFNGTISWVGLVIPHIVRLIVGRDTSKSIPLCITFGGIFMLLVDILSRTFTSEEIPLSAITGLFGTVIFIVILYRRRKDYYGY